MSEIEQSIKRKIEAVGVPLRDWDISINYGIKTGCNEAFVIDGETKDKLIAEDPKSAEIIRPILRGRDIGRYSCEFKDTWLIATHNGYALDGKAIPPINIEEYPAIKAHLDKFWDQISIRGDKGVTPYNLRNCAYMDDLDKQKILWGELSDEPKFYFDSDGQFTPLNTVFLMTGEKLLYLIAFLNSPISKYYFSNNIATSSGVGTTRWLKYTIETLPIPRPNNQIQKEIEELVLSNSESSLKRVEKYLYDLYGLTEEEAAFVSRYSSEN